jgi:hypothetical protein
MRADEPVAQVLRLRLDWAAAAASAMGGCCHWQHSISICRCCVLGQPARARLVHAFMWHSYTCAVCVTRSCVPMAPRPAAGAMATRSRWLNGRPTTRRENPKSQSSSECISTTSRPPCRSAAFHPRGARTMKHARPAERQRVRRKRRARCRHPCACRKSLASCWADVRRRSGCPATAGRPAGH